MSTDAFEFQVIGHRGNGRGPNENTLDSCRQGIAAGADRIEIDVQLIGGELVLAHPPRRPKESLRTILDTLTVPLVLHIKRRHFNPWHDRAVIKRLAPLVTDRPVTIASFWPGTLTYLKHRYPKLDTAFVSWWPYYDMLFARRLGTTDYCGFHRTIGRQTVRRARRRGINLYVWSIGILPPERARFRHLPIAGVITDRVSQWVQTR